MERIELQNAVPVKGHVIRPFLSPVKQYHRHVDNACGKSDRNPGGVDPNSFDSKYVVLTYLDQYWLLFCAGGMLKWRVRPTFVVFCRTHIEVLQQFVHITTEVWIQQLPCINCTVKQIFCIDLNMF